MADKEEKAIEFMRYLNIALKGLSLYPAGHPSISQSITGAFNAVSSAMGDTDNMVIGLVEGILVIDGNPLYSMTEPLHELVSRMKRLNIGTITLGKGVSEREIGGGLLRVLNSDIADMESQGGIGPFLKSLGVTYISVLEPRVYGDESDADKARRVYQNAISAVRKAMEEVRLGRVPSSAEVKTVINDMVGQVLDNRTAILGLSMIKSYDEYTFHHCVNVSILSIALAEAVGMPKDVLNDMGVGAALHDIGKIETYEEIIKKPGPLTEDEWKEVRKHPARGAEILRNMGGISELSIRVVMEHHLKYNNEGYPDMEGVGSQCEQAMCVSIADSYDALTTLRPYHMPNNPGMALQTMRSLAGKDFEPNLFERFVEVLGIYPPGTLVRLNTNEIAVVKAPNPKDPVHPYIRLLFDRLGRKVDGGQEFLLSEADERGWRRSVVSIVDPVAKNIDPSVYMW